MRAVAKGYDAVVIGGGHNGLVAASYIARGGYKVLVLERRSNLGGTAATEEIRPNFLVPAGAHLCGLLRPDIVRELGLRNLGLEVVPLDPEVVALGPRGATLTLWRDATRTSKELQSHSTKDAAYYPVFRSMMREMAQVVAPLMTRTPPSIPDLGTVDTLYMLRRGLKLRRLGQAAMREALRFLPMALADFLGERFESELLKATLASEALLGIFQGPKSPGTAFGLLHHYIPEGEGAAWGFVRGGMGRLGEVLGRAATAAGVQVRTESEVARITTEDGKATGVELANGERIKAPVVLSNADPKRTFLHLVDPLELDAHFLAKVRNYDTEGCVAKVNLALSEAPRWAALPANGHPPARIRIAPSMEYLERACDAAKYGGISHEPLLDITIPTVADPTLAPQHQHIMSIHVQYAPYTLKGPLWPDRREELWAAVHGTLEEHAPGIKATILHRQVLSPADLEAQFGLTGGHMHHGEMTLNQQFVLRPLIGWARYRTPIEGLYLCGSGTHPGGGITGAPGYNAAREVLRDLRTSRRLSSRS